MNDNKKSWICTVCGYVHHGPEAPDFCVVCGATKDLFELKEEHTPQTKSVQPSKWRCINCDYIHDGQNPPMQCPVCGALAERFEPYEEKTKTAGGKYEGQKIVIVGAGIAGISAAESARKTNPEAEITLISKESQLPYYRLNLTRYLAGEIDENQLPIHPESWFQDNSIEFIKGAELCEVKANEKSLRFRGADNLNYDKLILTIGSHPFVPPFAGANKENVTVLRSKQDADYILEQCQNIESCAVIGGGILGLETAGALTKRKVDVALLEGFGWLLPRQLNEEAGKKLEYWVQDLGVKLHKNVKIKEIRGDE